MLNEVADLDVEIAQARRCSNTGSGSSPACESPSRVPLQAPADPGGGLRFAALARREARTARWPLRSSGPTGRRWTSAPRSLPTTARPPMNAPGGPVACPSRRLGRVGSPVDGMRHWRRVRHLTNELEASPERDDHAAKARMGMISLGWRLGMSPEERAGIHAEAQADAERLRLGPLLRRDPHAQRTRARRDSKASGRPPAGPWQQAMPASGPDGRHRGCLRELGRRLCPSRGSRRPTRAIPLVNGDPTAGSGLAFVCPLAHAYHSRGMCRGYAGDLGVVAPRLRSGHRAGPRPTTTRRRQPPATRT